MWKKYHGQHFMKAKTANQRSQPTWLNLPGPGLPKLQYTVITQVCLSKPWTSCKCLDSRAELLHLWSVGICPVVTCISQAPCCAGPLSAGSSGRCRASPPAWWWGHDTAPSTVWLCPLKTGQHGYHHCPCPIPTAGLLWLQTVSSEFSSRDTWSEKVPACLVLKGSCDGEHSWLSVCHVMLKWLTINLVNKF